jgi:hypothetical protein
MTDHPDPDTRADREAWSRVVLAAMRYCLVMGEDIALTDPLTRFILWSNEPEVIIAVMDEALRIIGREDVDDLLRAVPEGRDVQARFLPPEDNSNGSGGVVLSPITLGPDDECVCEGCACEDGEPTGWWVDIHNEREGDSMWDRIISAWGSCPCPVCSASSTTDNSTN